jgi:hypothetical protein
MDPKIPVPQSVETSAANFFRNGKVRFFVRSPKVPAFLTMAEVFGIRERASPVGLLNDSKPLVIFESAAAGHSGSTQWYKSGLSQLEDAKCPTCPRTFFDSKIHRRTSSEVQAEKGCCPRIWVLASPRLAGRRLIFGNALSMAFFRPVF